MKREKQIQNTKPPGLPFTRTVKPRMLRLLRGKVYTDLQEPEGKQKHQDNTQ